MTNICSVDRCDNTIYARGWCRKHYRHVVESGHEHPLPVPPDACECGASITKSAISSGFCRSCYMVNWANKYKDKLNKYNSEYRQKNRERIAESVKNWRSNNRSQQNDYYAKKRKNPQFRLAHNLRSRLYDFLQGKIKHKCTKELVGCSWIEFVSYIESQFDSCMSWDNYGTYWSIDHIKPLIAFDLTDPTQLEEACNFKNLRPITITENCSKATKDKLCKM